MKLKYFFPAAALFLLSFTACTFDKAEVPAPSATVTDTCGATPTTHTIQAANNVFIPDSISVCPGDTVKWVLTQGTHTTTSTSVPTGAATWDQFMSSTGATTFIYVPSVSGSYDYVCSIHPSMIGKLVVK